MRIPKEVVETIKKIEETDFEVYLVGGCVRDLLLEREPNDWDIATNALPEEIQKIFPDSVYENEFGTVAVKVRKARKQESKKAINQKSKKTKKQEIKKANEDGQETDIVEVTTFRTEGDYSDRRRPDKIEFAKTIKEDLARRDFTINAMAARPTNGSLDVIDPFGGKKDLDSKIIRTVGGPKERLREDALRLVRAVRFAVALNFEIEKKTAEALKEYAPLLKEIAIERIRDEFVKIIMASSAMRGVRLLEEYGLLEHIIPELREGIGCGQNKHHVYTVWEHNIRALDYAAKKNYSLVVRLAALLHDVGKPRTKKGEGVDSTFHNHEVVGGRMAKKIMERMRFSKDITKKVSHLVRQHLFFYDIGEVTDSGIRRFIRRVGRENIDDLIKVREADRIGSGVPKAVPYRLRHMLYMIEKVSRDPITVGMLNVDGDDVMKVLDIKPGPRIGLILNALLEEVIDDPQKNEKELLLARIKELNKMSDDELKGLARAGREKLQEKRKEVDKEIKKKYYVK